MSKISEWIKLSLEKDLVALEEDAHHQLTANEMREYLGRDFYAYEKAIAERKTSDPRDIIDSVAADLADKAEALLREVRFALNAGHISIGVETKKQLKMREGFVDRALDLADQWESEIGGQGLGPTGREQYAGLFADTSDDGPLNPYYDVYRALEGTRIYRLIKAEEYEPNRYTTVNAIQRQFLHDLLQEDAAEEVTQERQERTSKLLQLAKKLSL